MLGSIGGGLAGAAAASLVTGRDFGDTLMSSLPSIIANTVGNVIADSMAETKEEYRERLSRVKADARNGTPLVDGNYAAEDEDIIVNGRRMSKQEKQDYDTKHGLFWHLGNIFSGRNWDGTENSAYQARSQAERATSDSVIRALQRVDKAATDTKLSPKFYYLQNPPMSIFDYQLEKPRFGVAQVNAKGATLGALEVASLLPALRAGKYVEGIFELTEGVAVNGRRVIDVAASYEKGIRGLYGEASLEARKFNAVVDGQRVSGIADDVTEVNGVRTAIDAKYVDDWATSPRNPASSIGKMPWAVDEQQTMISQAQKYSAGFKGGAIYHTNSTELAAYYAGAFQNAGIKNVRFIITPAIR